MKYIFPFLQFLLPVAACAQVFWTEDFGLGCDQGNAAASYTGPNGGWTVAETGTTDPFNGNQWYVSATAAGTGAGNCTVNCSSVPTATNRSLHIGNAVTPNMPVADSGAVYDHGGYCDLFWYCVYTNRRAESPQIDCSGMANISVSFNYFEGGDDTLDDGSFWYYDGISWSMLENLAKTSGCASGQWIARTVVLPSSADNNPNIRIGFNWTNNDDIVNSTLSFAVDDISIAANPIACEATALSNDVTCHNNCDGTAAVSLAGSTPSGILWSNGATTGTVGLLCPGVYSVTVTDAQGCSDTAFVTINQPPLLTVSDTVYAHSCAGCGNGSAALTVQGGLPPYAILWSNGDTTGNIDSLNPGTFAYTVVDAMGCETSDSIQIESILHGDALEKNNRLKIYPNPVRAGSLLSIDGAAGALNATVLNTLGQVVQTALVEAGTCRIGLLPPGIYLLSLSDAENLLYRTRVVLQ